MYFFVWFFFPKKVSLKNGASSANGNVHILVEEVIGKTSLDAWHSVFLPPTGHT